MLLIALLACTDGTPNPDDSSVADDTDPTTDDTEDTEPQPETICDDGLDNDEDGLADCLDSDCESTNYCQWPFTLSHTSIVNFAGREIECKYAGFPVDYDVPSCRTVLTSTMTVSPDKECPQCNRTFYGQFTYTEDSCEGGGVRPTDGYYGLIFAENKWVLFTENDAGEWVEAVDLSADDQGGFSFTSASEPVWLDSEECDNGNQHVGDITLTLAFKDVD